MTLTNENQVQTEFNYPSDFDNRPAQVNILDGPGEMDLMISLFRATLVKFRFQAPAVNKLNGHGFLIDEIRMIDHRRGKISFSTMFPFYPGHYSGGVKVSGFYCFRTKKGILSTGLSGTGGWPELPREWEDGGWVFTK